MAQTLVYESDKEIDDLAGRILINAGLHEKATIEKIDPPGGIEKEGRNLSVIYRIDGNPTSTLEVSLFDGEYSIHFEQELEKNPGKLSLLDYAEILGKVRDYAAEKKFDIDINFELSGPERRFRFTASFDYKQHRIDKIGMYIKDIRDLVIGYNADSHKIDGAAHELFKL